MKLSALFNKYKSLSDPVKASAWYTVCNVLTKGIALLATPVFTRLMTEEEYGAFAIYQSWYNIFIIFTSLNLYQSCYNKGLLRYEKDAAGLTSSLLALTTTITCGFGLVYLAAMDFWTQVLELSPIMMAAMFIHLFTAPALEFWAAQQRFNYKYRGFVAITLVISSCSLLLGMAAVSVFDQRLEARAFSDLLARVAISGVLYVLIFARGKKFFSKEYWKYGLLFSLPLIPHFLSTYILNQSDRLMISRLVGNTEAAYYSVAYTISTVIMLIVTAVNNSLIPYVYKKIHTHGEKDVVSATRPIMILMAALCVVTMVFAPEIITIFAGRNYADAIYVVPPVAASVFFIFVYSLFSTVEYYHQRTGNIALASIGSAVLNIVLNMIFIPMFGYYAAGYTTLVCYISLAATHYVFYRRILRQTDTTVMYDEKLIVLISAAVMIIMVVMAMTYQFMIVRYVLIVLLAAAAILFRKQLMRAFRKLKG